MNSIVAIDIAKHSLQVQSESQSFEIPNNEEGFALLQDHLRTLTDPMVVCEASGGYERALVRWLFQSNQSLCVVSPDKVRAFARSEGIRAKTDPIDAKMLLRFAKEKKLQPANPPQPAREKLAALLDRRHQLSDSITREKNRLDKEPIHTRDLIEQSILFLQNQIREVDQRVELVQQQDQALKQEHQALVQIKGVGALTASLVLAYLPEIRTISRNQLVALAGLAPFNKDSGKHSARRSIHAGRAKLRRGLYMATVSAARFNHVIQP
jgi:transposase